MLATFRTQLAPASARRLTNCQLEVVGKVKHAAVADLREKPARLPQHFLLHYIAAEAKVAQCLQRHAPVVSPDTAVSVDNAAIAGVGK